MQEYYTNEVKFVKNGKPITAWICKESDYGLKKHLMVNGILQCNSKIAKYNTYKEYFQNTTQTLIDEVKKEQFACKKCIKNVNEKLAKVGA